MERGGARNTQLFMIPVFYIRSLFDSPVPLLNIITNSILQLSHTHNEVHSPPLLLPILPSAQRSQPRDTNPLLPHPHTSPNRDPHDLWLRLLLPCKSRRHLLEIASSKGISLSQFYSWNKNVGSSCKNLLSGYNVCVGVIGARKTPEPFENLRATPEA
jgi:hypothetical protein